MGGGVCKSGNKNKEEKQKREGKEQLEVSELDPARAEDVGQVTIIRWSLQSEK